MIDKTKKKLNKVMRTRSKVAGEVLGHLLNALDTVDPQLKEGFSLAVESVKKFKRENDVSNNRELPLKHWD